jgi:hypothetical protein
MSTKPQTEHGLRVMRSVLLMVIFTLGSVYLIIGAPFPHGNPFLYALALSWLVAITSVFATAPIWAKLTSFSLALWEKEGEIYGRAGARAFQWVLRHSPLGWINPNLHLSDCRTDCERLLRDMSNAEGVHWTTFAACVVLGIRYIVGDYAVYGYALLLVRIPFDLYPIMLMRWNRGRICRVLKRQQIRSGVTTVA